MSASCHLCRIAVWVLTVITLAACGDAVPPRRADILLFAGDGVSPGDARAVSSLLRENGLSFTIADTAQLNATSGTSLNQYRLLIVPGGNFETLGRGLTSAATSNIRTAIDGGLNYLGICAGAFFAGNSPYNGLNLTHGVSFRFYALEAKGIRKAAVPIKLAGEQRLEDHYWEDGPELSGWGNAIAHYPDGTPAVTEGRYGRGWVILTGTHPEAPESWRNGMAFRTPASETRAYAARLIRSALQGESMRDD